MKFKLYEDYTIEYDSLGNELSGIQSKSVSNKKPSNSSNINEDFNGWDNEPLESKYYHTSTANGSDIFDTNYSETSYAQSFLNPSELKYQQEYKNRTASIKYMSPEEYYKICADRFKVPVSSLKKQRGEYDRDEIKYLIRVVKEAHKKFPLTYIDYTTEDSQEGLHRMYAAAEMFGWDTKFPVLVIDWLDKDLHIKQEKQRRENEIRDNIEEAVKKACHYQYENYEQFEDELQWTINSEFEYFNGVNPNEDVRFTVEYKGDECCVSVFSVSYIFDKNKIKIVEEYENTDDLKDIDIDDDILLDDDWLDKVLK